MLIVITENDCPPKLFSRLNSTRQCLSLVRYTLSSPNRRILDKHQFHPLAVRRKTAINLEHIPKEMHQKDAKTDGSPRLLTNAKTAASEEAALPSERSLRKDRRKGFTCDMYISVSCWYVLLGTCSGASGIEKYTTSLGVVEIHNTAPYQQNIH